LDPSYGCPPGTCVESLVAHAASAFPIFVPVLKTWLLGGWSRTSATPILHQSAAYQVTPPHLTLVVSSVSSMGDPIKVHPSSSWLAMMCQEALVLEESVDEMLEEGSAQEALMM
jgi:hypothetical protein